MYFLAPIFAGCGVAGTVALIHALTAPDAPRVLIPVGVTLLLFGFLYSGDRR